MCDGFNVYWIVSAVASVGLMGFIPSKMTPMSNLVGTLMVAFALGWLIWPLLVIAVYRSRRREA